MVQSEVQRARQVLIAHVIFRLDVGGLENGLVNLINGLDESRFRHVVVCIEHATNFKARIRRRDVEIISIHKKPGTDFPALWRLYTALRRIRPDIVHTRNIAALDALVPALLAGVRVRIHGEHGWDLRDLGKERRRQHILRKVYRPLVHHYVVLSRHQQRYLIEEVGIDPNRITQLYNGVDLAAFRPSSEHKAAYPRLIRCAEPGCVLIGTVCRMQPVKNPLLLARAFVRLIRGNPQYAKYIRLVMIGDGPLHAEVSAVLRDAGLSEIAWLPGARDDVAEILRCLDIYVQPSIAEGVSNTILEAMASGLPVVATEVGGNPELVADGVTGAIVPADHVEAMTSAIERYVTDSVVRESHGGAARTRVENYFSMSQMVNSYSELYGTFVRNANPEHD